MLFDSVRKRLFEEDYGTAQTRIPMGITALNIIRHHPWLGIGFTNYVLVAPRYDISAEGISYHFPRPVHNEFLLIAAELGIPALLLFLTILLVIFRYLLSLGRAKDDPVLPYLAVGFFGGWVGWCLHHQFEYLYSFLVLPVWVYYFGFIQALRDFRKKNQ
jgi:O-antigen ligase